MVKKIVSILLLCCLLLNVIGYHIIFYIRQAELKAEMKKMLSITDNHKNVETFSFALNKKESTEEIEWEGDDEFRLNGEMYDVIEKKTLDDQLIVRCISDKKETALLKDYESINKDDNSKNKSALLLKLVGASYVLEPEILDFVKNIPLSTLVSFQSEIIFSYNDDVLTPPPQYS